MVLLGRFPVNSALKNAVCKHDTISITENSNPCCQKISMLLAHFVSIVNNGINFSSMVLSE
jgi:6-phosphogluconate dehydrogenase